MVSPLVITSARTSRTPVDAAGKTVIVAGKDCTVELTGRCTELRVIGRAIRVKAEEVVSLSISGAECEVSLTTLGKAKVAGTTNRLAWGKVASGLGGEPPVSLHGVANEVRRS